MKNPNVVNMVLPDDDGRILLLHRLTADTDWWELPGGKIEPHEDTRTAAVRECEEELGIHTRVLHAIGKATLPDRLGRNIRYEWLWGIIEYGTPEAREPKHVEAAYKDLSQFNRGHLDLSPSASEFARRLKNGE